jgi:hypothetical protein
LSSSNHKFMYMYKKIHACRNPRRQNHCIFRMWSI